MWVARKDHGTVAQGLSESSGGCALATPHRSQGPAAEAAGSGNLAQKRETKRVRAASIDSSRRSFEPPLIATTARQRLFRLLPAGRLDLHSAERGVKCAGPNKRTSDQLTAPQGFPRLAATGRPAMSSVNHVPSRIATGVQSRSPVPGKVSTACSRCSSSGTFCTRSS